MNKKIRVLFVLLFLGGFVALGMHGTAWADKLNISASPQVVNGQGVALERLAGTVDTTPPNIQTQQPGIFTVGSIATWTLDQVAGDIVYSASVTTEQGLPKNVPGPLLTSPIKLMVEAGKTLGVHQRVCFPVPPGKNGVANHWDGRAWVKNEIAKNNQACVTLPASAPNPTYAVLSEVK
jgi:hypothetical protein